MPKDPVMLLSWVNTQLRDNYKNPDELCKAFNTDRSAMEGKLEGINYFYDELSNQFK
jgi:hypothetical protein